MRSKKVVADPDNMELWVENACLAVYTGHRMSIETAQTAAERFLTKRLMPASFLLYIRKRAPYADRVAMYTWDLPSLGYTVKTSSYATVTNNPLPLYYFTEDWDGTWFLWIHDLGEPDRL